MASNFNSSNIPASFDCNTYFHPEDEEEYPANFRDSTYYNNKALSEEAAYVKNRQVETSFIGNSLEKPQIFLKKILLRETKINEEQLNTGTSYAGNKQSFSYGDLKKEKKRAVYVNESGRVGSNSVRGRLKSHNNFLSQTGFIKSNIAAS